MNSLSFCNGPYHSAYVMPVRMPDGSTGSVMYATSVCNGATNDLTKSTNNITNAWFYQNAVIQTNSSIPTVHSWLYVPGPIDPAVTNNNGILFTPPRPRPKIIPRAIRAGRRAVRRSIDLYARFRGYGEVRQFLRGERVIYRGIRYDYRVKKSLPVIQQAMQPSYEHIPYRLDIYDKQGKHLASGCIVFPGLPIFDQLLALSLHVREPDEELKMVNMTNWSPRLPPYRQVEEELLEAA